MQYFEESCFTTFYLAVPSRWRRETQPRIIKRQTWHLCLVVVPWTMTEGQRRWLTWWNKAKNSWRFICAFPLFGFSRHAASRTFWHVGGAWIWHGDGSIQHQGIVLWGWLARNTRGLLPLPDGGENVRLLCSTPMVELAVAPHSSILFPHSGGPFSLFEFVKLPVGRCNPPDFSVVFSFLTSSSVFLFFFLLTDCFFTSFLVILGYYNTRIYSLNVYTSLRKSPCNVTKHFSMKSMFV